MKQLFVLLSQQDLRIADVLWMLSDNDRTVRQLATQLIVGQSMEGAMMAILKELREASGAVRSYYLAILPKLKDEGILDRVDKMFRGREAKDREVAVDVILAFPVRQMGKLISEMLRHDSREYRYRALQKLLSERAEGAPMDAQVMAFVRELSGDKDERIRIKCIQALCEAPDAATVDLLIDRLQKDEYNVKTAIIKELEKLMNRKELGMVDRMLPLLSVGDDMVRSAALNLTVKHTDPIEVIRKILEMSQQLMGWMRDRILSTIRDSGADMIPALVGLLDHGEEHVRTAALLFAANFEDKRLVKPAIKVLLQKDWWTRIIAMDLLGRLKDEAAVDPLIQCLTDEDARWSAVEALTRIGSARALGPIAKLLNDPTPAVRLQVVTALEAYNDPRCLPLLKQSMEKDPEMEVRERALMAFRGISEKNHQNVDEKDLRQSLGYGRTDRPIDKLLMETRRLGGSDLHVTPLSAPTIRVSGELKKAGQREFTAEEVEKMILGMLDDRQRKRFDEENQLDFCYVVPGVGRYRANIYRERLGMGGVFRTIPNEVPTFLDTRLPQHLVDIANFHQGLVIVSGTAGSGKSTTLAALVNLINEKKRAHVLTLEDPIEFVHPFKQSLVNQREIGKHSNTFASALRAALREDPDCIVVGELRDQETMTLAMTAAETGHLVIATMHTTSAVKCVDRLVEAFPPREQPSVRMMLSESLKVVINQHLVRRSDKRGRVAFHEVLMVTGPVRNLIRDSKTGLIASLMTIGKEQGQQTIDMALQDLVAQNLVTPEEAYMRAEKKELFEPLVSKEFLEQQDA